MEFQGRGARVRTAPWLDSTHDVFIFRRLARFMIFTAFRLGEIVGNGSSEIMSYEKTYRDPLLLLVYCE